MLSLVVFFLSVLALSQASDSKSNPFIVNGNHAASGQFSYFVSLRYNFTGEERHGCGGSILNQRWIVSAAHCTDGVLIYAIVAGIISMEEPGTRYEAVEVINHPEYFNFLGWVINDISLLKTERPIEFSNLVQPIPIARREIRGSASGTIAGFGATVKEFELPPWLVLPEMSDHLLFITKRVAPEAECRSRALIGFMRNEFRIMPFIYNQVCTVAPVGTGICAGDSGSAIVVDGFLVGIASYVLEYCARGHPEFYVRVSSYAGWIDSIIA